MTAWSRAVGDDGETFVYADEGSGPLVILLHGFPDTPHGWGPAAKALTEAGYRVVRPWLRGYHPDTLVEGRPYDLVTISSDPIRLLDALGERKAVLGGHDWGSMMVFGAAALHPDRLRAVVPVALPHPQLLPRDPRTMWAARHFFALRTPWAESRARWADFAYFEHLYRRWAPRWRGPDRDATLAEAKAALFDDRALSGALDYYRALRPGGVPELTRDSPVPGLVVADTTDIDLDVFERSAGMLGEGSETLAFEGAGHWPHREFETEFHERLISFLENLPVTSR
jgi:pimeloyl-ACP methyl ester carboxylesterase